MFIFGQRYNTQMVFIITHNVAASTIISPKHNKFDPSIIMIDPMLKG